MNSNLQETLIGAIGDKTESIDESLEISAQFGLKIQKQQKKGIIVLDVVFLSLFTIIFFSMFPFVLDNKASYANLNDKILLHHFGYFVCNFCY